MLHAGLDLSRKKLDVCLLSQDGEIVAEFAASPDAGGLRGLARRVIVHGLPVRGVIESMTGARFVHDTLEELGWDVLPMPRRSRGWRRWRARPTRSTRASWRCFPSATWCRRDLAARPDGSS
jgi:hypothetical protein